MPEENQAGAGDAQQNQPEQTFEAWLEEHADIKPLYEAHTQGLKGALETERASRKELEKQLRGLSKQAEAGSAAQQQLSEMADKLAATDRQNKFYDSAHAAGVKNLKLAWKAAEEFLSDDGEVDLTAMKKAYPELFSVPKFDGTAGQGMQNQPQALSMNDIIRRAAGRQ